MATGAVTVCDIERKRGDTRPYTLTLKDSNKDLVDVEGYTVLLTINTTKDPDLVASPQTGSEVFQASGAPLNSPIPSPLDGKLSIDMSAFGQQSPRSDNIQPGNYFYDIQVTDANLKDSTVLEGKFKVIQDVTK